MYYNRVYSFKTDDLQKYNKAAFYFLQLFNLSKMHVQYDKNCKSPKPT